MQRRAHELLEVVGPLTVYYAVGFCKHVVVRLCVHVSTNFFLTRGHFRGVFGRLDRLLRTHNCALTLDHESLSQSCLHRSSYHLSPIIIFSDSVDAFPWLEIPFNAHPSSLALPSGCRRVLSGPPAPSQTYLSPSQGASTRHCLSRKVKTHREDGSCSVAFLLLQKKKPQSKPVDQAGKSMTIHVKLPKKEKMHTEPKRKQAGV